MTTQPLAVMIEIEAAREHVWRLVSDLRRMSEWSPQCRRMQLLGRLREGAYAINWNRHGRMFWPTVSKIERVQPNHVLAFRTLTNNSTWWFEIKPSGHGVVLIERRLLPATGTRWLSRVVVDHLLGGEDDFDAAMVEGMRATVAKIKAAAEQSRPAPWPDSSSITTTPGPQPKR